MRSIRTYLLLALLAIITIVTFLSLLHGYQSSIKKAHDLFDDRLRDMAKVIANANHDIHPHFDNSFEASPTLIFQIWSNELGLLARSSNAPTRFLTDISSEAMYKDINFNGYRWRTFTYRDTLLKRWIITAERTDIRYTLAENVVTASIIPIVLAIPVAGFIIWFAIGLGLKPLTALTKELSNKQADDLTPLAVNDMPEELTQLVITTNALFERLNSAFLREQQFSADAAHELRTPISALKVQVHNLQHNASNKEELQPFVDGIERMGQVIEQILSLYRHSPDQAMLKQEHVDLCAITQEVIAQYYDQIAIKHQLISLTSDERCLLFANHFAVVTLVQNLITNANKYTPDHGEILVRIQQTNTMIKLSVEDSGQGIPESEYERVFERFYRVNGDQHDSGTVGCGLGLAIVHHIAILHSAEIRLEKSSLGGLKITIIFPHQQKVRT
ncbi:MAG: sensor histidine kinase N-terminal domain-containing protein [Piscirickettsiaceae bacterium]|nr:sensor histidine kinase N-terminal domain-containing protein [Piscirickettsiaceae bacterium]